MTRTFSDSSEVAACEQNFPPFLQNSTWQACQVIESAGQNMIFSTLNGIANKTMETFDFKSHATRMILCMYFMTF